MHLDYLLSQISTTGWRSRPQTAGSVRGVCQECSRLPTQQRPVSAHWIPCPAHEGRLSYHWKRELPDFAFSAVFNITQPDFKVKNFTQVLYECVSVLCLLQQQAWATDDVAQIYDKCMADLEQHLHAIPPALAMNPQTQALRSLLEAVALARNSRDGIAALGLLQKVRV